MRKLIYGLVAIALATLAGYAISHSGGLDRYGCHTDHKNGDYHCHR